MIDLGCTGLGVDHRIVSAHFQDSNLNNCLAIPLPSLSPFQTRNPKPWKDLDSRWLGWWMTGCSWLIPQAGSGCISWRTRLVNMTWEAQAQAWHWLESRPFHSRDSEHCEARPASHWHCLCSSNRRHCNKHRQSGECLFLHNMQNMQRTLFCICKRVQILST